MGMCMNSWLRPRALIRKQRHKNLRHAVAALLLSLGPCFVLGQQNDTPTTGEPPPARASAVVLSNGQIRELIRQAGERDVVNDQKQRDYTYVKLERRQKRSGKGEVNDIETRTYEVMILYGEQVERLIARNGQPLSQEDAAKEEDKLQKLIHKRKNESEADRTKRLQKKENDRQEAREFVREVADAFDFRLTGVESMEGRETYVIDADPRPGYRPRRQRAKILPKFRFRVWIDRDETQWVKLDAQFFDTVSLGWFVVRLRPGSRVLIEETRVNDDVWLPRHVNLKIDARVALLKNFKEDIDVAYWDYKKFRVDAKILP
jgi:hypothetical protein